MINTWEYIKGNLDQLKTIPSPACAEENTRPEPARELFRSGATVIPVRKNEHGEYFFGEPRIKERVNF